MKKGLFTGLILLLIIILAGCQVHPRYRTGEIPSSDSKSRQKKDKKSTFYGKNQSGLTTHQLIELGIILQSYLGRPYKWTSTTGKGFDCSELVVEIFERFNGTRLPRTAARQSKTGSKVRRQDLSFGDLVFFKTDGKKISHVGIYIENNEFLHASSSLGVIISSIKEDYWKKRFVGCRRILP